MNNRIFYYVQVLSGKYTDGNDCLWISEKGSTYEINNAKIFTSEQAEVFKNIEDYKIHPVHKVDKLIQLHVPVRSFKRNYNIEDGTLCYLLSKRDTVGSNAAFWAWNHLGYVCDIRNAQIFKYSKSDDRYNREFEFYVPVETVKKKIRQRIDIQDLNKHDRMVSHVLTTDYFKND